MSDTIVIDGEVELLNVIDGDPDVFIGGGGSQPTGTKSILLTEAGTKTEDVADYAYAEINAVTSATASGAVASFSDGAEDVPMDSCLVDIEPVQSGSGDPSPSNIRPISGWDTVNVTRTGKNLLAINATSQTTMGLTVVANSDGSITVNGTVNGRNLSFTHQTGAVAPQKMYAGSTITLSGLSGYTINQAYLQLIYMGEDESTISIVNYNTAVTYTFTQNATLRGIYLSFRNGTTFTNQTIYPQLEIGSTATSYEPYVTPTEYPVSLGQTVYGGTLDVVTGVLTVDRAMVDLGSLTWNYVSGSSFNLRSTNNIGVVLPATISTVPNAISSVYPVRSYSVTSDTDKSLTIVFATSAQAGKVWVHDTSYTDATAFKTAMNGVQLVYELATPTTVQLSPTEVKTLLGSNSVWADSGDISVGYKADIFLYADSLETIIDTLTGGA